MALLHCIAQIGLALLTFWVFLDLQFGILHPGGMGNIRDFLVCSLLLVAAFALYLMRSGQKNENVLQLDVLRSAQVTLHQLIHVFAPLFLYPVAAKDHAISHVFLFSYLGVLGVVIYLSNRSLPSLMARLYFQGHRKQESLICGPPEDLTHFHPLLERKTAWGMQALGPVTLKPQEPDDQSAPVEDTLDDYESIVSPLRINKAILTRTLSAAELNALTPRCEDAATRLFVMSGLEEQPGRLLSIFRDERPLYVSLREEPLERPFNRIIKRVIDVAVALPVVFFVIPWTSLLVWLIHRLQSPGPLFFRQRRTGLHNEEFWILKYRTMKVNHGRDAEQATVNDARIFPLGRWLRKLSMDELPQFINVLWGEMSIVGPRPHLFEHDALFAKVAQFYWLRTRIKPGITGLAQVRGYRGETKTDEQVRGRLESDLYYMENWSPMLDCLIIAHTAWQMIRPPNSAY